MAQITSRALVSPAANLTPGSRTSTRITGVRPFHDSTGGLAEPRAAVGLPLRSASRCSDGLLALPVGHALLSSDMYKHRSVLRGVECVFGSRRR